MNIDLGLCMVVRDEENRIDDCLSDIIDLFQDVVIVDTGSTDKTKEILRSRYGIDPIDKKLKPGEFDVCHARNFASSLIKTPLIMTLDADERVERRALQAFLKSKRDPGSASYFCTWNTYKGNQIIRDYKCLMYRKDILMVGCPHENVQYDIRRRNMAGSWIDYLTLHHYPEQQKSARKIHGRINSMLQAIEKEPEWYRHYWFLGYTLFRQGRIEIALHYLTQVSSSCSAMFPVECLNSKMVMATIYANQGERTKVETIICCALDLYEKFEQDFEVRFNTRLKPWLENALLQCRNSRLSEIKAYEFSY